MVGTEADRVVIIGERTRVIVAVEMDVAARIDVTMIVGIELQRPIEVGEREVDLAGVPEQARAVAVGGGIGRVEADRGVQSSNNGVGWPCRARDCCG